MQTEMKMRYIGLPVFLLLVIASLAVGVNAQSSVFWIDNVKINGENIISGAVFEVERGDDLPVQVILYANESAEDVTVTIELRGYEGGTIEEETSLFNVQAGKSYSKYLVLDLPYDLEERDYQLIVTAANQDEEDREKVDIAVQRDRHNLDILDVEAPNYVKAGEVSKVNVVVKNRGYQREDDVFVKVIVPGLGIVKQKYLGDLTPVDEEDDGKEDAEEVGIFLRIPENAESGLYELKAVAFNARGSVQEEESIYVDGKASVSTPETAETLIGADSVVKSVAQGRGVAYQLTLTNAGSATQTYTVAVEGEETWAASRVDPSVLVLGPGQSGNMNVYVTAREQAVFGQHVFTATVRADGQAVKNILLTANVSGTTVDALRTSLIVAAIVLIVVLIVLAIVIASTRGPAESKSEELY